MSGQYCTLCGVFPGCNQHWTEIELYCPARQKSKGFYWNTYQLSKGRPIGFQYCTNTHTKYKIQIQIQIQRVLLEHHHFPKAVESISKLRKFRYIGSYIPASWKSRCKGFRKRDKIARKTLLEIPKLSTATKVKKHYIPIMIKI